MGFVGPIKHGECWGELLYVGPVWTRDVITDSPETAATAVPEDDAMRVLDGQRRTELAPEEGLLLRCTHCPPGPTYMVRAADRRAAEAQALEHQRQNQASHPLPLYVGHKASDTRSGIPIAYAIWRTTPARSAPADQAQSA
jgi:hypothetical protein